MARVKVATVTSAE
jgi:hypothetical protein